jgi:hypothetical protein
MMACSALGKQAHRTRNHGAAHPGGVPQDRRHTRATLERRLVMQERMLVTLEHTMVTQVRILVILARRLVTQVHMLASQAHTLVTRAHMSASQVHMLVMQVHTSVTQVHMSATQVHMLVMLAHGMASLAGTQGAQGVHPRATLRATQVLPQNLHRVVETLAFCLHAEESPEARDVMV